MGYLQAGEYEAFGLGAETADEWIQAASALIEGHCKRPSLMTTTYVERSRLVADSRTMRLSYLPVGAVTGVRVRYGRVRRGELLSELGEDWLGHVATTFGLPGVWSTLSLTAVDLDVSAGELLLGYNPLGLNYNEAEVTYTAGFDVVPVGVKVACAQVVKNAQAMPALNVRTNRMDTLQMQYFSGDLIDASVVKLLQPYVARKVG